MSDKPQSTPQDPTVEQKLYWEELRKYRDDLYAGYEKNQGEFDKNVILLSGGALAVTFAFVKDYVGPSNTPACPTLLLIAWLLWAIALGCSVFAYFMSARANQASIDQLDRETSTIRETYCLERLGEPYKTIGRWLTVLSGFALLLGALFAGIFVSMNMQRH